VAAKRQTVIALTAGAILAVAIGVLGAVKYAEPDSEAIRVELLKRIEELEKIPPIEAIRKDAAAEELLRNEEYRKHALSSLVKLERAHPKLHELANLERAGQKEIPPFLAKCKDLARVPPDELDALQGEVRALLRTYGTTRYGDELRRVEQELKVRCDTFIRCGAKDVVELSSKVQKLSQEGHFAAAYLLVNDFERKYVNAMQYDSQLREIRSGVLRKAEPDVAKLLAEGQTSEEARMKALKRLEGPDFKGLPLAALDAAVRALKPR
jgi:hypothetical protein